MKKHKSTRLDMAYCRMLQDLEYGLQCGENKEFELKFPAFIPLSFEAVGWHIEILQIATCDAKHKGKWSGQWEECIVLRENDDGTFDIKCLSDNKLCCGVKSDFVRKKPTHKKR